MSEFEWLNNYEIVFHDEILSNSYINKKGECRFCKKSSPEVSFNHLAHVVPEFLGNKYLYSNDECDNCNQKFGNTIETDLANYIGIHRTLTTIEGKNGVPQKNFQKEREKIYFGKNKILELVVHADSQKIKLNKKDKTIRVESVKEPFFPFGVFKALTKIALSILPDLYLKEFADTINWVNSKHEDPIMISPDTMRAFYTFVPGVTPFPAIQLLLIKRKDYVFNMPYMIFRISFKNFIYQIPLLRNRNDLPHIGEMHNKVSMSLMPNYHDFCVRRHLFGKSQSTILDLSGKEKIKRQKEIFELSFEDMLPLETKDITLNHRLEAEYDKLKIVDVDN